MLEITVKTLDSQNHSFTCEDDITVRGFKEHIADRVSVPAESQRLIYCGRVLQDDKKLNDYGNVNGKVIHLVQRAPPQPESRSSTGDGTPRQNNNQGWPHARVQFRGQLHRNAMYLGAMSLPPEYIEDTLAGPVAALSNTLSQTRLATARRMLDKFKQLMDRLDDPSVPLHPTPTENNASEQPQQPQASAPEETDQASNVNSSTNNVRNGTIPAASEIAAEFSAAALINIRLVQGEAEDRENRSSANRQAQAPETETSSRQRTNTVRPNSDDPEAEPERAVPERPEQERPDAVPSSNTESPNYHLFNTGPVPRPPQMAELLERLVISQDRLRPYIARYRVLMLDDPALNPGTGRESVAENQRIIDGVSESLHFLSHACHALSDIIVDMEQQPPRNLRCRPIIVQHSAILQAGIPVQVESQVNVTDRNPANNNNTTDEGNEATRPSSPTSGTSDQTPRSINIQSVLRSATQNANGQLNPANIFGTLLSMPSNVELSMDLSPQSAMDLSSPGAVDGSENEQGQSNNNNTSNGGDSGQMYSMTPPFALIRDALQSVLSERHNLMETSSGTATNTPTNAPFVVTIGGQQMDIGTPNSGQSTQARSNIGTHPTTSTQTRSTARPHVLHPHSPQIHVGLGIGRNMEFDPFLPCNSHHMRREAPRVLDFSSTSQPPTTQANQSTTSESHSRSQSASHSSSTTSTTAMPGGTTVFTGPMDIPFHSEILEIARLTRARPTEFVVINGNAPQSSDRHDPNYLNFLRATDHTNGDVTLADFLRTYLNFLRATDHTNGDVTLADFLRTLNVRVEEFAGRNILVDIWVYLLRVLTFGDLMQLSLGQHTPLARYRRCLRGYFEQFYPDAIESTSQERAAEQIVSHHRPYLQAFVVPEDETASRRVDVPATIESLLRKFCLEFLKLLCNNDLDDATFAQEAVTLAKKLEDQSSAALQYIVEGGPTSLETVLQSFVNQLTEGLIPQFFQPTLLGMLNTRIREYSTRTTQMSRDEIANLLVYKDEPSAPCAEATSVPVREPQKSQKQKETAEAQALPPKKQNTPQQQSSPLKKETKEEEKTAKPEEFSLLPKQPMETEVLEDKVTDDPMDLANGEEVPETFPGAENLPADWVPIIARDAVRQRRQVQMQALQGGPIPFSDAYLTGMPSKRRKLIEQQKPQLLVNPTHNNTAIAASVERLVREGISHSHLQEAEGAASAVATAPGVKNAFGQAIKECLHPNRLKTPDFPNSRRFPNASKYFADGGDKDKKDDSTPASTTKTNK